MAWLSGKKTYIVAALMAIATGAKFLGYLSPEAYTTVEGLLLGGGLAALRAGVAKS